MDATYERSLYEATLDLDYAIRVSQLHARLFTRLKRTITAITLLAGSAAFVALFGASRTFAGLGGLVVAVLSTIDLVWDFGAIAAAHQRDKEALLKLRSRLPALSLEMLDSKFDLLRASCADCLAALAKPAYNDNVRRHGRESSVLQLTRWERLVHWLA